MPSLIRTRPRRASLLITFLALACAAPEGAAALTKPAPLPLPTTTAAEGGDPNVPGLLPLYSAPFVLPDGSLAWGEYDTPGADTRRLFTTLPILGATRVLTPLEISGLGDWWVTQPWAAVGAVNGLTWLPARSATKITRGDDHAPGVIGFDDRGRVVRSATFSGREAALLRPTVVGRHLLSGLDFTTSSYKRRMAIVDERGRTLGTRKVTIAGMAGLDGGVLVSYISDTGHGLIRLTAGHRWRGVRGLRSSERGFVSDLVQARFGTAVALYDPSGSEDVTRLIIVRGGRVVRRAVVGSMRGFPGCDKPGDEASIDSMLPSPGAGLAAIVNCQSEGDRTPRVSQTYAVGIDAKLHVRWIGDGRWFQPRLVSPDGRLAQAGEQLASVREPGAPAPTRGAVRSARRLGSDLAEVTIVCRGHLGRICNGRVRVRIGGRVRGTATYALPARPGDAAGVIRRTVELSGAPSSGRVSAGLVAVR